jgi:hypothetical protein
MSVLPGLYFIGAHDHLGLKVNTAVLVVAHFLSCVGIDGAEFFQKQVQTNSQNMSSEVGEVQTTHSARLFGVQYPSPGLDLQHTP